jgi:hypothetical protein
MSNDASSIGDRPSNDMDSRLFYVGLIAAIVIFLFFALPILGGHVYTHDDLSRYHLPFRFFYAQSLASGNSFLWLPNIFCGFYLHGEGQVGMYHPLHLLLYRFFPLSAAFNIELVLSFPLMAIGMFLFLRRWNISRAGAMLGAIVYTFSGFHLLHYMHMNATAVAAHTPWLLIAIDVIIREGEERRTTIALAAAVLLTASQALLGHPPVMWLSMVIEGGYILLILFPWKGARGICLLVAAKALGMLIGCIQLVPHWDAALHSVRRHASLEYLQWPAVHPAQLPQLVAPYFYNSQFFEGIPYELKIYNGAIPLLLVILLFIKRKELGPLRKPAMGAAALGVISLVLALGKYGYLHRLQTLIPLIGMFRTPCRYVMVSHFAMAVIAAIVFTDLSAAAKRGEKTEWPRLWPIVLAPIASALPVMFAFVARTWFPHLFLQYFAPNMSSLSLILTGPALFVFAAAIVLCATRGIKYGLIGIMLFVAFDLGAYGLSYIQQFPARDTETFLDSRVLPLDATQYRLESRDNLLLMKGIRLSDGYASIQPARRLEKLNPSRLRAAGAGWLWSKYPDFHGGTAYGMRLPTPLPRARLIMKAIASDNPNDDIGTIDIKTTALVEEAVELTDGPPGKAIINADRPGKIAVATESESRQILVLSESYHKGWRAFVNDRETPVVRVYGDFMGCVVDAGRHETVFSFKPASFRIGAWLSLLGVVLTLGFIAAVYWISKEKEESSAG